MVFDPGLPGFDHGKENREKFAHGRDEGNFVGYASCAHVPLNLRITGLAGGGQGGHVRGRPAQFGNERRIGWRLPPAH